MNFYSNQHPFYCGIDLHANQMYACVVDQDGKKHLHRNFKTRQSEKFFGRSGAIRQRHRARLRIDFQLVLAGRPVPRKSRLPFVLGHALYLKAIHGGKVKNDKLDSEKLALLLRGGNFTTAYAYPQELRATRDSAPAPHPSGATAGPNVDPRPDRQPPTEPADRLKRRSPTSPTAPAWPNDLKTPACGLPSNWISNCWDTTTNRFASSNCTSNKTPRSMTPQASYRLQTIPGVGRILAMTMLYEIHDIKRFPTVGQFLSYCRLVRGSHTSAGKTYGSPGKKIGNAHFKWAFSEAVPLLKRVARKSKPSPTGSKRNTARPAPILYLAVKLGRAVYYMLKRGEAFELHRMLLSRRQRGGF